MHPPRVSAGMVASGRTLGEPRLSPDGATVAFVSTAGGRSQLVVVDVRGGPERVLVADPAPRSARPDGSGVFTWLPDGSAIAYVTGDGALWLVPSDGLAPRQVVAPDERGSVGAPAMSTDGAHVAYVVDQHHVMVAALDAATPPRQLSGDVDFCFDPVWSPDGRVVAWHEWDVPAMPWDSSRIVACHVDVDGAEPVTLAGGDGVAVGQPRFSADGTRLAFVSDANGWNTVWVASAHGVDARPLVTEQHEHADPSWGLGQRSFAWSPDGGSILHARNDLGFGALWLRDVATGEGREVARAVHVGVDWTGDRIVAVRSGARTPTQLVVYDARDVRDGGSGKRRTVAIGPVAGFGVLDLAEPLAVTWLADDGATIHGRLYTPDGTTSASRPLLVWIHGGPTGQWGVGFNARFAYFLERGWAILVPDHRGSTGHGRAYMQTLAGRWGDLDVADVAAGMREAADQGWGDPARMVPMGGSAGGFTALNLLAHHGDLCAAGVALSAVADLLELADRSHRFERHSPMTLVGPLPRTADRFRDRSPVTHAAAIRRPVLLLHGDADDVVPVTQFEGLVRELERASAPVEHHVYEGEGHGWGRPETVTDELERIDGFLARHVVGLP